MQKIIPAFLFALATPVVIYAETTNWAEVLLGDWSLTPAGTDQVIAVMRFEPQGTVVNTTVNAFGSYFILNDDRLLLEFSDSLVLGQLKQDEQLILMKGYVGVPQPVNLVFSLADEAASAAASQTQAERINALREHQGEMIRRAVLNNLRLFASAAQHFMLDEGVTKVSFDDIVGEGKMLEAIDSVDGEDYSNLTLTIENSDLSVTTANGIEVTYTF